jgi:hydrogenase maturation protein HypF
MPGGEKAIHEPWRMAISFLWNTFGSEWRKHTPSSFLRGIPDRSIQIVEQLLQAERGLTRSSSCGRLFDAVSAMVCCRSFASYEAQAAIALEAFCYPGSESGAYPFAIGESGAYNSCLQIDSRPLFLALTEDMRNEVSPSVMSARFHAGLVNVLGETVIRVARRVGMLDVCLSGGSFQNTILSQGLESWLTNAGFVVHQHQLVPPGDGGLSLGQLMVAANSSLT